MEKRISEVEFEPEENDCFITDVVRGGYDVSCDGKYQDHFVEYDDAIEFIKTWQDDNNYFPNTWFIDDHGGYALVNLDDKLAYEGTSYKNISLKKLVPEEFEVNPLNGMRKKQAINYLYKTFDILKRLKGFFTDDYWQPINDLIGDMQKAGVPIEITNTEYGKDTNGNPSNKIWECEIPFTNQNNRQDKLYVRITAAGAGSVQDPLSRYDVTCVIS